MNEELIKNYLENKITYSWYKNAKIDYNVNGKFLNIKIDDNNLIIMHKEEKNIFKTVIAWFQEYTPEQLYNIWMEADWEEVA